MTPHKEYNGYMKNYTLNDDNMLIGVHLATSYPVNIQLTKQEMDLATMTGPDMNIHWNSMCALVYRRTGQRIQGQIQLDFIVVNGIKSIFH
jgi:hypothetical protein